MDEQNLSSKDQDGLAGEVLESVGMPREDSHEINESHEEHGNGEMDNLPKGVKDRLGRQEKRHQKEMRQMRAHLDSLNARMSSQPQDSPPIQATNPYSGNGVDEQIHKAVSYALQHKEMEERKANEAKQAIHVHKQYQDLHKHLDSMADKYDDFHDTVLADETPFTPAMRDYALTLPKKGSGSAGEVLYKLGKNPDELHRISKLHPIDQASEMAALSHALAHGGETKSSQPKSMGQIKNNPVSNSRSVTEKTSVSDLRKRMRDGWK